MPQAAREEFFIHSLQPAACGLQPDSQGAARPHLCAIHQQPVCY